MRTRKSNRVKPQKAVVEADPEVDFEDEDEPQPVRRARGEDDDDDFKSPSPAAVADDEEEEETPEAAPEPMDVDIAPAAVANDAEESDFVEAEEEPQGTTPRKARKPNTKAAAPISPAGYMDILAHRSTHYIQSFTGAFDRSVKGKALLRAWYGQEQGQLMGLMLARWYELSVLPPKVPATKDDRLGFRVWTRDGAKREKAAAEGWYARMKASQPQAAFRSLSEAEAQTYLSVFDSGFLPVLVGPVDAQSDLKLSSGNGVSLHSSGAPVDNDESGSRANAGWLLDAGGIVPSLAWKPAQDKGDTQLLALAVAPHADQDVAKYEKGSQAADFQTTGTVQIWAFSGEMSTDGLIKASRSPPYRLTTLCLDRGRARRVQWSPICRLLAILCSSGCVCVVEPREDGNGDYDKVEHPIAVLELANESTQATTMAWINCNRLSVGYTDGSITLWSIFPKRLLSRHPVYHNHVMDMASAYPTFPYLISSSPVGGQPKLIDLRAPAYEVTESGTQSVNTASGVTSWSDHLLGFYSPLPSSNALNTVVGFSHHAFYPVSRRIATPDSFVTCLSAGRTHPYLLLGTLDGSLWSLNPQNELFSVRYEISDRIRVFQHEHRSAGLFKEGEPGSERGAARILQGFRKEKNPNPRTEFHKALAAKKTAKKGKAKTGESATISKDVIHESLTRMTAVEWNPNPAYGCWAAVAMASGLVRVMDLGLEAENTAG